jgi:hypothetical protein
MKTPPDLTLEALISVENGNWESGRRCPTPILPLPQTQINSNPSEARKIGLEAACPSQDHFPMESVRIAYRGLCLTTSTRACMGLYD